MHLLFTAIINSEWYLIFEAIIATDCKRANLFMAVQSRMRKQNVNFIFAPKVFFLSFYKTRHLCESVQTIKRFAFCIWFHYWGGT